MSTSPTLDKTSPSTLSLSIASLIFGLVAGYFIGSGSSIGLFGTSSSSTKSKKKSKSSSSKSWPNSYDVTVQQGSDTSDEEFARAIHTGNDGEADNESSADEDSEGEEDPPLDATRLKELSATNDEVKLMLVVRTDLGMTKGKIAAQCGHATLALYKELLDNLSVAGPMLRRWEAGGQPKIAVKCEGGGEELLTLLAQAMSLGLVARVIRDAGRTQIQAGSMTVLGVLGPKSVVDQVTGGLKLL